MKMKKEKQDGLKRLRMGETLSLSDQIRLVWELSIPAILAQISSILMQYIDASMVGRLGANDSASIGLISSSTWLINGIYIAFSTGFTVQVAHKIGAGDEKGARSVVKQGLSLGLLLGVFLSVLCLSFSRQLPIILGGSEEIYDNAVIYFVIYACSIPFLQLNNMAAGMLQCAGNMKIPSFLHVCMCFLDVLFNAVLIFPETNVKIGSVSLRIPCMGLGVAGAALGTALSVAVIMCVMLYFLLVREKMLKLRKNEKLKYNKTDLTKAVKIATPIAINQMIMGGAYVAGTMIVAPLGTVAVAANSFSITAESLCYMPGYGIGTAATTMIGQSIGAKRADMTKKLGWLTTILGMLVMTVSGALMYIFAPVMIGILSPVDEIRALGSQMLRIEAFCEPFYAASIVAFGVFRGAGDTVFSTIANMVSMWIVRLPFGWFLAHRVGLGLKGVWIAMSFELCVRGILFLILLSKKDFTEEAKKKTVNG